MAQTENWFFFSLSILQWNDIELNSIHYSRTSCTLSSLLPPPTASYKAGVPSPGLPILKCLREQIQVSESSVLFKYLAEPTLIRIRNIQVNCLLQCYYSLPSISIKKKKKITLGLILLSASQFPHYRTSSPSQPSWIWNGHVLLQKSFGLPSLEVDIQLNKYTWGRKPEQFC